ncbi:MAG: polysaccharide deacetylase family protein [Deinococcales bacterium]
MYLQKQQICLVDLGEYASGKLERCSGRRIAALSFDDAHSSQFRFLKDGTPDPNSALGLLYQVYAKPKATFFINTNNGGAPFGSDSKRKVRFLQDSGLELGNHTVSHPVLSRPSGAAVAREIDGVCAYLGKKQMLLAYPYGIMPKATHQSRCKVTAAFRAWLGYFEGKGQHSESGALLAPLPNSSDFVRRRLEYPRLNISSYADFMRDVASNPNWVVWQP